MPLTASQRRLPPASLATLIVLLCVLVGSAGLAQEALVTPARPAEYMIYQYPDTALVVRVDVPEAEFGLRVRGPDNALIKSSAVPGRRIGPVFHFIDAVDLPRQLMIEVTPGRAVDRSAIGLEILQFAAGDRNAGALARAYRLFSIGTETPPSDDTTTWAMKTYSLRNAAELFDQLGMEHMRLWSEYFATHLVLHSLNDGLMSVELSREIRAAARRAGFADVELAAAVLEGDALLRQMAANGGSAGGDHQQLHRLLHNVAALAERLGMASEAGRALYNDGLVFDRQGEPARALEQYRRALEVIAQATDPELLNQVRATAATAYEALGSTSGALEMLDHIAGDLAAGARNDADLELADRLFEKGRLLNATYRYREAQGELARSLDLQRASGGSRSWGPTGLELAWALYSLGRPDEAISLVQESLPRTPLEGNRETLARAYGSLANMLRAGGQFEQAARARETQGTLVGEGEGRAELLFETAMDARGRHGRASRETREMLRWSRQAAAAEGDLLTAARSALQLCLLEAGQSGAAACADSQARPAYQALRDSALPRLAAEAGLAWFRVLRMAGRTAEARAELDRLLDELHWYRRYLPGVVGAWYLEYRAELAADYLSLALGQAEPEPAATHFLLALERIRAIEAADGALPAAPGLDAATEESLRALLARRAAATGDEVARLAGETNQALAAARRNCPQCGLGEADRLSADRLRGLLGGLDRSEALLVYYLADSDARAVLAGRAGTRVVKLAQPAAIRQLLARVRGDLAQPPYAARRADFEALGDLLLGPLEGHLPEHIYLLPTGGLRAIPFDALLLGGRHLAERHRLANLASLGSLERRRPALPERYRERVFVAGNPQSQRDPFRFEMSQSAEINAVTERFVGPGLHVVQGVALRQDEFADERFTQAALVHLAIPGLIDLALPERSRLLLAAGADSFPGEPLARDPGAQLSPADLRAFELDAGLVLFSGTVVTGGGQSLHEGRLALVSEILDAGAAAAVFSLWPVGPDAAAHFAGELYGRLESEPDIVSAFTATRRAGIAHGEATKLGAWAGFQLFIR